MDVSSWVVVLQDCRCFVEGAAGSCIETCVMCDGGSEEVNIKVEEAIDIKDETPDAISLTPIKTEGAVDTKDEIPEARCSPPINTEHEVRLWGVCELVAAHALRPFIASKRKL